MSFFRSIGEECCIISRYLLDYKIPKYLDHVVDIVFKSYLEEYGNVVFNSLTDAKRTKIRQAIACFSYNAVYNLAFDREVFDVTLDDKVYSKPLIYNCTKINRKVSYTYTKSILDWLHSTGRIRLTKGGVTEWYVENGAFTPKSFQCSSVQLSEYMIELFNEVAEKRRLNTTPSVIEVRDSDGITITKRLGNDERLAVRNLNTYNALARSVTIGVGDRVLDVQLKKVFNNSSFELGGRNYVVGAGVITREDRSILTIDGEDTVELDFKALHPRIAATLDGVILDKDFDPYSIEVANMESQVARYFGKWAVLILLNTGMTVGTNGKFSFNTARKALISQLRGREEVDYDKRVLTLKGTSYKLPDFIDYSDIIQKCLERNDYIRLWFTESSGLRLQNYDSKIMDLIISRFNEMGEVIIPVHDSIVVKKKLSEVAIEIMTGSFKEVLGNTHNCIIT
jgi:hypothetical protein